MICSFGIVKNDYDFVYVYPFLLFIDLLICLIFTLK